MGPDVADFLNEYSLIRNNIETEVYELMYHMNALSLEEAMETTNDNRIKMFKVVEKAIKAKSKAL